MTTGVVRWISVGVALAAVLACTRTPVDDAYFPLGTGRTWSYTLTPDGEGATPMKLTVAVVGDESVGGTRVTRERIEVDGREHFLFVGRDEQGIYRHATQSAGEPAPSVEEVRDYFLKQPLEVGRSWQSEASPAFLDVPAIAVPIESRVVSTSETVRTPAGEFTGCVKVHVTGSATVPDQPDDRDADASGQAGGTFTLDEETWYAKDVGLVKSIVTETLEGKRDEDRARVTTELQALTR